MSKLNIVSVKTDATKCYRPDDKFVFTVVLNALEKIEEDVQFDVIYFGDAYSDHYDQKIASVVIGPIEAGMQSVDIETSPIDFSKIPIKILFGLSSILIAVKYAGQQFMRVGYVVDVTYPGVNPDALRDSDDKPLEAQAEAGSAEGEEDETVEIMDDEELSDEEDDGEEEGDLVDEDEAEGSLESYAEDGEEDGELEEEELSDDGEDHPVNQLEEILTASLMNKSKREPIPLETPIVPGKDEFEYRGIAMKQSCIEMSLLDKPFTHVFDIAWEKKGKGDDLVESSDENDKNVEYSKEDGEAASKRPKLADN
ncbi:histone chaperone ASF1 [Pancytospora philotis]|nr:histone chaperone ASF1 [Pancytospora philotis]